MRKISQEKDYTQLIIIIFFVFLYFQIANKAKQLFLPSIMPPLVFTIHFYLTILFFYGVSKLYNSTVKIREFIFTLTYTLLPTLIWFTSNSILYRFLPPPRSISLLGKTFSIFFISYSVSLLCWKLILFYLAIRFASKLNFFKILYMIILYVCIFIPYSLFLYNVGIFRIPFI